MDRGLDKRALDDYLTQSDDRRYNPTKDFFLPVPLTDEQAFRAVCILRDIDNSKRYVHRVSAREYCRLCHCDWDSGNNEIHTSNCPVTLARALLAELDSNEG